MMKPLSLNPVKDSENGGEAQNRSIFNRVKTTLPLLLLVLVISSISFSNARATTYICPPPECRDECSFIGQTWCYGSNYKQVCGNYDSDSCLELSSPQLCSVSTSCGYKTCNYNQKPSWFCSAGSCSYTCLYDSSCDKNYDYNYLACYNNDVYRFDSWRNRQSKYQECGEDYCGGWGSDYCYNNDVYKKRTCYQKECREGSCYSDSYEDIQLAKNCGPGQSCQNGECLSSSEYLEGPCCDGYNYRPSTWICNFDNQIQYGCPWGIVDGADVGKRTRTRLKYCSGNSAECSGISGNWLPWTSWEIVDSCGANEVCSAGSSYCHSSSLPVSNARPVQEKENDILMVSILEKREGSSSKWEKEIKVDSGENIDFLLVVMNKGKEGLKNVTLRIEFPKEVIYKDNFKINGDSLEGNIESGLNIGTFSPGMIKTIVFQGEASSGIEIGEKDIDVHITAGDLSVSDSVKISFEGIQKQKAAIGTTLKSFLGKWYNWILVILGIVILFYFIKGIFNWFKK